MKHLIAATIIFLAAAFAIVAGIGGGRYDFGLWNTGFGLLDPGADRIAFWDDSADSMAWMDLKEGSASLLSTTTVSLAADAETTIYTVPTGKRCVLSHAVLVAGADAVTSDISVGADGAETDFVPATDLQHLDAQYDAVILQPIPAIEVLKIESYAAGTLIKATVTNHAGGATNTLYLFGFLY